MRSLKKLWNERPSMCEDPEYARWKRQYPKFPGVAKCVELFGRRNLHGAYLECVFGELQDNAKAHAAEVIAAFHDAQDPDVRRTLLEIIAEAALPEALPIFIEHLHSEDESLRFWAECGLRKLNTHESRTALWEAGLPKHVPWIRPKG